MRIAELIRERIDMVVSLNGKTMTRLDMAICIMGGLGSSAFSCILIVDDYYAILNIVATVIISFVFSAYILSCTIKDIKAFLAVHRVVYALCILLSLSVAAQLWIRKTSRLRSGECLNITLPDMLWHIIGATGIFLFLLYSVFCTYRYIQWIREKMDLTDKKIWIAASTFFTLLVFCFFVSTSGWYASAYSPPSAENTLIADVYGMDSGGSYNLLFADASYYDIRHPIMTACVFPYWAVVNSISKIFVPGNYRTLFNAMILQFANVQFLIMTGFHLRVMTRKREIWILYLVSFPMFLYTLSFEKYQIISFLMVLYLTLSTLNMKESSKAFAISAGFMPTSVVLGANQFVFLKRKELLGWIMRAVLFGFGIMFYFGRGHILLCGFNEAMNKYSYFTAAKFPISRRILMTIGMIKSCFIALTSIIRGRIYTWDSSVGNYMLGLLIIVLIIIGLVRDIQEKKKYAIICIYWILFSFVFLVICNFAAFEAPLYNILYSWAILILAFDGFELIITKMKLQEKYIYISAAVIMVIINLIDMIGINMFYISLHYCGIPL